MKNFKKVIEAFEKTKNVKLLYAKTVQLMYL